MCQVHNTYSHEHQPTPMKSTFIVCSIMVSELSVFYMPELDGIVVMWLCVKVEFWISNELFLEEDFIPISTISISHTYSRHF